MKGLKSIPMLLNKKYTEAVCWLQCIFISTTAAAPV